MVMNHLACIMDGNRRWASARSLMPWRGHQEGVEAVRRVISFALEHSISYVTLYAFSLENFKRSAEEKNFLFSLMVDKSLQEVASLKQQGIKVQFVGDKEQFPALASKSCATIEQETAHCDRLTLFILFCYGGRQEMVAACKSIAQQQVDPATLNEQTIKHFLWSADVPDIDLIIRTGGLRRMSNFLQYQSAYSELYFLDTLWPDITTNDLEKALDYFNRCKRNFGK